MQTKNKSLRFQILTFLAVFLSISLALISAVFIIVNRNYKNSISEEINVFTNLLTQSIDNFIDVPENYLEGIKEHIEEIHTNPENQDPNCIILDIVNFTKTFETVFLIDSAGKVINSWPYNENYLGIDMSNQDYFLHSGKREEIPDKVSDLVYWSDIFISSESGYKTVALSTVSERGIVTAYYNINQLEQFIALNLPDEHDFIAITDIKGNVIAHTADFALKTEENLSSMESVRAAAEGRYGIFVDIHKNRKGLSSVTKSAKGGFLVIVFKDYEHLFQNFQKIYMLFTGFLVFTAVLFLIFIFLILNRFFQPLSKLQTNMMQVASGSYTELEAAAYEDFRLLTESFSLMQVKIKEREDALKKSISERDTLIWELNHRTKNNMQLITGFTRLYGLKHPEADPLGIMAKIQSKIETISLVHEKLYRSSDLSSINFCEYIEELVPYLIKDLSAQSVSIRYEIDIEEIYMLLDYAVPCGLVLNEFILNSLKYAFNSSNEGFIKISAVKSQSNEIIITYSDDGVGLPDDFTIASSDTIGFSIINSIITSQLYGQLEFPGHNGFKCRFSFSLDTYEKRI